MEKNSIDTETLDKIPNLFINIMLIFFWIDKVKTTGWLKFFRVSV